MARGFSAAPRDGRPLGVRRRTPGFCARSAEAFLSSAYGPVDRAPRCARGPHVEASTVVAGTDGGPVPAAPGRRRRRRVAGERLRHAGGVPRGGLHGVCRWAYGPARSDAVATGAVRRAMRAPVVGSSGRSNKLKTRAELRPVSRGAPRGTETPFLGARDAPPAGSQAGIGDSSGARAVSRGSSSSSTRAPMALPSGVSTGSGT
jgi:hypothetical protein